MPVSIQSVTSKPNRNVTFAFEDDVIAYVVGVAWWKFSFGKDDHHVRTLAMSLNSNKTAREVSTTINATLRDDSGHDIDNEASEVRVCCVAVTRAADATLSLATASSIPSGGSSAPINLPSSSLAFGSTFLSGWSLSQGGDHHVKSFKANAGFAQEGNVGRITSVAEMVDTSGNDATGSIDGALVAAAASETGIVAKFVANQQTTSNVTVNMGSEVKDAAVLVQSLMATFGSKDHHVKTIGGGCPGWSTSGNAVILDSARAFLTDDSGNEQSNTESSVSLVVLGVPF